MGLDDDPLFGKSKVELEAKLHDLEGIMVHLTLSDTATKDADKQAQSVGREVRAIRARLEVLNGRNGTGRKKK